MACVTFLICTHANISAGFYKWDPWSLTMPHSLLVHLSIWFSFPLISSRPFFFPLCITAKQSNGCWHILEPCCPTLSLMCRPSPWLSRVQLGSRRDTHTKAISPATNNRSESRTSILFTSQIESVIYIQRAEPSLSQDFRSANVGRLHCGRKKTEGVEAGWY